LRIMRNQLCENSKNFSSYLVLPELNHYALESLANPISNKKDLVFFFFDSKLYNPRVQIRSRLTKQVIKKNKIKVISYNLSGKTKLAQAFEALQMGTWVTFYLAMLNKVNPAEIHWVNWFKKQLK
ncbi:MAG: SIS domain-containing protein, partial [Patescibacteria group bacterium]